jgi:peptidoglycan/xylan/chitin deacetylase (PgdA/CDA1 family)
MFLKRKGFGIISLIVLSGFLLPVERDRQTPFLNSQDNLITAVDDSTASTPLSVENPGGSHTSDKFVIINFDDSDVSQYIYAKPILDKYGFKATFFEVCGWLRSQHWQDIAALKHDGMDIESHTMTHPNLNKLSAAQLDYEIGHSRQCFLSHGINATVFAYPYGKGSNNATVANTVAKHYNLARTATYSAERVQTLEERYAINSWAPLHVVGNYSYNTGVCSGVCYRYNNSQMLDRFVEHVNSQDNYNEGGAIRSIPIIVYHSIVTYPDVSFSKIPVDTTVNLFDAEMKYLHDNGFKVLTMADLGYDESNNSLYIKSTRR